MYPEGLAKRSEASAVDSAKSLLSIYARVPSTLFICWDPGPELWLQKQAQKWTLSTKGIHGHSLEDARAVPLTQRIPQAAHVQNIWLFIHDHDLASLDNLSGNRRPAYPNNPRASLGRGLRPSG